MRLDFTRDLDFVTLHAGVSALRVQRLHLAEPTPLAERGWPRFGWELSRSRTRAVDGPDAAVAAALEAPSGGTSLLGTSLPD